MGKSSWFLFLMKPMEVSSSNIQDGSRDKDPPSPQMHKQGRKKTHSNLATNLFHIQMKASFSAGWIKLGKISSCCCDCPPDALHSPFLMSCPPLPQLSTTVFRHSPLELLLCLVFSCFFLSSPIPCSLPLALGCHLFSQALKWNPLALLSS